VFMRVITYDSFVILLFVNGKNLMIRSIIHVNFSHVYEFEMHSRTYAQSQDFDL